MLDAIKPLLDSDLVNDETRTQIEEAWESKINETKEQVRAELREEFAQRYEHDKSVMVEALDRMVTDNLTTELEQMKEEKKNLAEDRAKFVARMQETTGTFDKFLVSQLAEEIQEFQNDRALQTEYMSKIEAFVGEALAKEITEFQEDRNDVVETKVRLVKEARSQFKELKDKFINNSAQLVKESVTNNLNAEISQLREDIEAAKDNSFGRKIFEAFASEFSASHLNENQDIKDLKKQVEDKESELIEAKTAIAEKSHIIENKDHEIESINEAAERKEIMADLMKPLNKEKGAVMRDLLESVQTTKLQAAYERYLPVVLDGKAPKPQAEKQMVSESRVAITGDKEESQPQPADADTSNIVELRKLAGLK
jgi:hypothetical protein